MKNETNNVEVPLEEFEFSFARSGGPGGQNVNKVNSKAILRWHVVESPSLPEDVRAMFLTKYANRITAEGDLIIMSQKHRDQSGNMAECLAKLKEMIASVEAPPVQRRPTKPGRVAKQRRVEAKRELSKKKQQRRPPQTLD